MRTSFFWGVLLIFFMWGCISDTGDNAPEQQQESVSTTVDTAASTPTFDKFGIPTDSVEVQDYIVKRNESLYLILDKFDFSPQEIYSITQEAGDIIDFNQIKPGQKYRAYISADSTKDVSHILLQNNPLEYVVLDWQQDSLQIYKAARPLTSKTVAAYGKIENSLYQTISSQGGSRLLANRMANIFAWQINFFGLRPGDSFKVLYEKHFIGDNYYGIGDVKVAKFTHRGEIYRAYKFEHEGVDGYFTEDGESVQKALLQAPFKFSQRVSSNFSRSRYHPILKKRVPHTGVDYAAPPGTPILAVGDGTVTEARYRGANGNIVKITHNSTYRTAYLHLRGFARGIRPGVKVEQGEVIGYVGSTGRATGPHLHYSLYKND
ncbi:MAG: peptidoglycan DD-metalloendopeptidase family protein, partial [Aliifodinibius sp.]|nr:peptidoglycan DD-metalloendopeptidase family protein [Fodinibius sp.]NIV16193.1 peptidoglycan DD-metalloendopeptidase family protein [Fodinibius sp.]NIY26752.1 peptidoglycan DD-metalloendopeptidase family protein [Fodinibius sp.]